MSSSEDIDNPFILTECCETMVRFNDYQQHVEECTRYSRPLNVLLPYLRHHAIPQTPDPDDAERDADANPNPFLHMSTPFNTTNTPDEIESSDDEQHMNPFHGFLLPPMPLPAQLEVPQNERSETTDTLPNPFASMLNTVSRFDHQMQQTFERILQAAQHTQDLRNFEMEIQRIRNLLPSVLPERSDGENELTWENVPLHDNWVSPSNMDTEQEQNDELAEDHDEQLNDENEEPSDVLPFTVQLQEYMSGRRRSIQLPSLNNHIFSNRGQPAIPLVNPVSGTLTLSELFNRNVPLTMPTTTLARQGAFNDYEFNLMLSHMMGNVERGVNKIGDVANVVEDIGDETDVCAICQETFKDIKQNNMVILKLLCSHIFCNECIKTWLSKHVTCPVCKVDLEEEKKRISIAETDQDYVPIGSPTHNGPQESLEEIE